MKREKDAAPEASSRSTCGKTILRSLTKARGDRPEKQDRSGRRSLMKVIAYAATPGLSRRALKDWLELAAIGEARIPADQPSRATRGQRLTDFASRSSSSASRRKQNAHSQLSGHHCARVRDRTKKHGATTQRSWIRPATKALRWLSLQSPNERSGRSQRRELGL